MARDRRSLPRWLRELAGQVSIPGLPPPHPPHWQEPLWTHVGAAKPDRLLLRGTVHFPDQKGTPELCSPENEVRCGLGRPAVSSKGTHGLYLLLSDEAGSTEASALLLTPAAYALFRSSPAQEQPDVPTYSLAEPFIVLGTERLRAEFVVREVLYDPAYPQIELISAVTLEIAVWQLPGTTSPEKEASPPARPT